MVVARKSKVQDPAQALNIVSMRTVLAVFMNDNGQVSGKYSYFVPEGDRPKVDDMILTSVEYGEANHAEVNPFNVRKAVYGARIAKVIEIETVPNPKATRFYVALVGLDGIKERNARNLEMKKQIEERKATLAQLDEMLLHQGKVELYRQMAKANPQAKALLTKLGL